MASEGLTFYSIDIQDPGAAKSFITLEPFLPFSCSFIELIQNHLIPHPDPQLKVWATFDSSNHQSTSEAPELFTVVISTLSQGCPFCSADASPGGVASEERFHREKVARLFVVTSTSLARSLPGHEEDSAEYPLGVVYETCVPPVKPYWRSVPTSPCCFFFRPPPDKKLVTITTGPEEDKWLVADSAEADPAFGI